MRCGERCGDTGGEVEREDNFILSGWFVHPSCTQEQSTAAVQLYMYSTVYSMCTIYMYMYVQCTS